MFMSIFPLKGFFVLFFLLVFRTLTFKVRNLNFESFDFGWDSRLASLRLSGMRESRWNCPLKVGYLRFIGFEFVL